MNIFNDGRVEVEANHKAGAFDKMAAFYGHYDVPPIHRGALTADNNKLAFCSTCSKYKGAYPACKLTGFKLLAGAATTEKVKVVHCFNFAEEE